MTAIFVREQSCFVWPKTLHGLQRSEFPDISSMPHRVAEILFVEPFGHRRYFAGESFQQSIIQSRLLERAATPNFVTNVI